MAKTRAYKETAVRSLAETLGGARGLAFARLEKHSVKDDAELRRLARGQGIAVLVVKKTLLARAAAAAKITVDAAGFAGTTALAVSNDDEIAPAKLLYSFSKTHPGVKLVAAVASGAQLPEAEALRFAQLPSLVELRGMLASVVAGPLRGLVTVLAGPMRGLVTLLTRRAETLPPVPS
jgi:large subunit ribosomal protein L10